jgi:hypothetical protein
MKKFTMLLALTAEKPTPKTGLCKESRAKVNLNNCKISKNVGANELKTGLARSRL